MLHQIGTFEALGKDGRRYTIFVYQGTAIEGPKLYRTADGHAVNRLGEGEYRVAVSGLELRSGDSWSPGRSGTAN
jgi:hypothetical protein